MNSFQVSQIVAADVVAIDLLGNLEIAALNALHTISQFLRDISRFAHPESAINQVSRICLCRYARGNRRATMNENRREGRPCFRPRSARTCDESRGALAPRVCKFFFGARDARARE